MSQVPGPDVVEALLARARRLAQGHSRAEARVAAAEAFQSPVGNPATPALIERAIAKARAADDPLAESAALDHLIALHLAEGDLAAALSACVRSMEILRNVRMTALSATEHFNAPIMAAECAVAAGDLTSAREFAECLRDLPFYREEGHLANGRLLLVTVMAGDWAQAQKLTELFLDGWQRAGRPEAGNLSRCAYAAATMHGLRGDRGERERWLGVVDALTLSRGKDSMAYPSEFFDAWLLLHHGDTAGATAALTTSPEQLTQWHTGMWRPWYAALWAESAVLCGSADTAERVSRGRACARGNPIATAMIARSAALVGPEGDRDHELRGAADALHDAGCRYQWARTLIMLGGEHRSHGESVFSQMGATPMVWPVSSSVLSTDAPGPR